MRWIDRRGEHSNSMRLLFISNLYPPVAMGGYERLCFDIAHGLRSHGHRVDVLTAAPAKGQAGIEEENVLRLLKVRPDFNYEEIRHRVWIGRNRLDVEWHNAKVLTQTAIRLDPDLIVFFSGRFLGGSLVARAESRHKVVYRLADDWLMWMLVRKNQKAPWQSRLYKRLLQSIAIPAHQAKGEHLIFCSESLRKAYREVGADVTGSVVIYPGIPPELFHLRPQRIINRRASDPFKVLYSGRISPEKGIHTLLEALAIVRRRPGLEETTLTIMGTVQSKSYLGYLSERILNLGIGSAIRFLPAKPRDMVPEVYCDHDVLAFPSEGREPFGLTVIEAMAMGLPVIASDSGGPAEVVRDRWNGFTFEAGNAVQLADQLSWVLANPRDAAAIGRRASHHVRGNYDLATYVQSINSYLLSESLSGQTSNAVYAASDADTLSTPKTESASRRGSQ